MELAYRGFVMPISSIDTVVAIIKKLVELRGLVASATNLRCIRFMARIFSGSLVGS
jgi:hypothetical protein